MFNFYWRFLGLPFSRFKGWVVDAIPFSVVEFASCLGGIATLYWLLALKLRLLPARRTAMILGPVFLAVLGLGQGAFPWSLAPTAWRASLPRVFGNDSLGEDAFKAWAAETEGRLLGEFRWDVY